MHCREQKKFNKRSTKSTVKEDESALVVYLIINVIDPLWVFLKKTIVRVKGVRERGMEWGKEEG